MIFESMQSLYHADQIDVYNQFKSDCLPYNLLSCLPIVHIWHKVPKNTRHWNSDSRVFHYFQSTKNQATMMSACDGEVLGLWAFGNGRSCVQHHCCGMLVVPNDIIKFKKTEIDGIGMGESSKSVQEEAIKAVLICNGTECCTVGFLCKSIVWLKKIKQDLLGTLHRS